MKRAVELAARGRGWVNPNPLVGCVLVRDGCVIGEGWHTAYGRLHAEREALASCERSGESARGATAYVTLEPCCHTGKQPPCCDALIESGISRVVIGSADPNPIVAGRGIEKLLEAGIEVVEGVMRKECDSLNRPFFHFIQTGRPLVIAKYAMTLDGKIATFTGKSKWITGRSAREHAHSDRATYAAIMVGVNTVIADDPMLDARYAGTGAHQPTRIICDTRLRTPLKSKLVQTARHIPTVIATCSDDEDATSPYEQAGCSILRVAKALDGRISVVDLLDKLGEVSLDSVIVEGGATLLGSIFDAGCVDRVHAYIAPKVFGGASAPSPVGGMGVKTPAESLRLSNMTVSELGCDILVQGDVSYAGEPEACEESACSLG